MGIGGRVFGLYKSKLSKKKQCWDSSRVAVTPTNTIQLMRSRSFDYFTIRKEREEDGEERKKAVGW